MREVNYNITLDGITPSNVQFGGMQGEHNATRLNVTIDTELFAKLEGAAYRFEAEDGAGCRQTIAMGEIESKNVVCSVPQSVTCNGGNVTIRLIFSKVAETEIEYILYSFPIRLRFDLTSNGELTESKDASDISAAVALAKGYTEKAEQAANMAENAAKTAVNVRNGIEQEIAESLTNAKESGEFDGKDGVSVTHEWNGTELTVTSASGTSSVDLKGEKGDKGNDGADGKDGADGMDGKDGADGTPATHSWNGTVLTVTSASGTSSADLKGEKGDKGDQGQQGIQGEKGDKGDDGSDGKDGVNGKDGISATHSWNGTVLTVTSASGTSSSDLKGEKGDTGATGSTGPRGEKGDKGDKGEDGADYILTDDDKREIATKANAVSYSVTQDLTDEQKQTARTNIDAVSQTELEDGLDEKVDASLVVDNLVSSDNTLLIDRIPNGDAVAKFITAHSVSSSQIQSLTLAKKARARQNIDVDGGKWELLYTIEGDGETNTWEYTQFANGSPLKLTAVSAVVIQDVAEAENSYGFLNAYCDAKSTQFPAAIYGYFTKNSAPTKSGTQRAYGVVEQYKGQYRAYSVGMVKTGNEVMKYTPYMQAKHTTADYPYIDRIKVQKQTGVFSAGNKIEIYGVRYYE